VSEAKADQRSARFACAADLRPHDLAKFLIRSATMTSVSIYEAKTHLSALIQADERGEEVVITNRNRPVARLVPAAPVHVFGSARKAFERSGLTEDDIAKALAPMNEEELREWGID
jgi:prevent-host-death family protein